MKKHEILTSVTAILLVWLGALGVIALLDVSLILKIVLGVIATILTGLIPVFVFRWETVSPALPTVSRLAAGVLMVGLYSTWDHCCGTSLT